MSKEIESYDMSHFTVVKVYVHLVYSTEIVKWKVVHLSQAEQYC